MNGTSSRELGSSSSVPARGGIGARKRTLIAVVLAGVIVSGGVLGWALVSRPSSTVSCGGPLQANPSTSTPIKHLFVIVKENHAFENYFGGFPGVAGYPPNGSLPRTFSGNSTVRPFPLPGYSTNDLPHDVASSVKDYDNGKNDLFVAVASSAGVANPQDAVGYYGPRQLPAYYAYAANYTLGDHFFTGFLGPTDPNRVFDITGYAGSWGTDAPPPTIVSQQPTIFDQFNTARIPWDYDWSFSSFQLAPTFFPSVVSNPCASGQLAPVDSLGAQLQPGPGGGLSPSLVFIDTANDPFFSEHPPENVTMGEQWTVGLVNAIFSSPLANSSAVLIWFDESGGFWDPVPPPLTSTGREGFRVPFLVLSPWTPPGKVCSETLDPASVLSFIDQNWRLPFLNARVGGTPGLSCFFNFSTAPRSPLLLSTPISFPAPNPPVSRPAASGGSPVASPNPSGPTLAAVWRERSMPSEAFWPSDRSWVR